MKNLILIFLMSIVLNLTAQNQIIKDFSTIQCDSIIRANVDNPNFVILDIRTPTEYIPQHLEGAITRDFYDSDFEDQLDKLDKDKIYVMHCRSGGRSGSAIKTFKTLGFKEVYNMLGGIIAWNRNAFPTTKEFAPRIMLVTEKDQDMGSVQIGTTQKAIVTITNRANDELVLSSITASGSTEFTTNFADDTKLLGAEDYSFEVTYAPTDIGKDIITYTLESNAGNIDFSIEATGVMSTATSENSSINSIVVSPNPVIADKILVEGISDNIVSLILVNSMGQVIFEQSVESSEIILDMTSVPNGIYSVSLSTNQGIIVTKKIIVK